MFYEQRYKVFESDLDYAVESIGYKSKEEALEFFKSINLINLFRDLNQQHPEQKLNTFSVQTKVTNENLGHGINCKIIHTLILFPEPVKDNFITPDVLINESLQPDYDKHI